VFFINVLTSLKDVNGGQTITSHLVSLPNPLIIPETKFCDSLMSLFIFQLPAITFFLILSSILNSEIPKLKLLIQRLYFNKRQLTWHRIPQQTCFIIINDLDLQIIIFGLMIKYFRFDFIFQ
jgi:hypothetical protein